MLFSFSEKIFQFLCHFLFSRTRFCSRYKRALACIWLIYEDIKIPHLKGEAYTGNSSYVPIYTNYIPTEFLINGIVSALLTVVNVICIFITAIIVLKIKEVAAPYTSSPDLRRYENFHSKILYDEYFMTMIIFHISHSPRETRIHSLGGGKESGRM